MALGGFFIWTHTFNLVRRSSMLYHKTHPKPNSSSDIENKNQLVAPLLSDGDLISDQQSFWEHLKTSLHKLAEELKAPPTVAAIVGFTVGSMPWLKSLLIGEDAPLRVIQDSFKMLGEGTIPCITLIMGGNLTQGLQKSGVRPMVIIGVICVRYVILPIVGIGVVKAAGELGFLTLDPLYRYLLMIQFTVPPAMNIGTMAQLFDVGQEECSVIFLWTYMAASLSLTMWSTVFMWIVS
ncbi:protein PIN-LIKES 7-like [Iris pallida]|uniref:Protein PIN-LIKES 7-like n=1 Tax=Iris pallida TaxID=29817 RepID=A0AAX6I0N4_IRIPA|nr:protein PIN-LIKES 7-like [Iris pallida]